MRGVLLILFCLIISNLLFENELLSQTIDSIQVLPENPSNVEEIFLVTFVRTGNQGTYLGYEVLQYGSDILVKGCYYEGLLTVEEFYVDTISLGQLSSGSHTITFVAYRSLDEVSCEPNDSSLVDTLISVVNFGSGIDANDLPALKLYPNPVRTILTISDLPVLEPMVVIEILDAQGRLIKSVGTIYLEVYNNSISFSVEGLPNGIYYLRLLSGSSISVEKFLKD